MSGLSGGFGNALPRPGSALVWCEQRPRRALALLALLFFLPGFFTMPPLDRDESRFVQATKQMVETGDLVEIRFQDRARNKKPVGVYWLQALPASLLSGPDHNRVWAYRLPSMAAAILAVLLTHAIGCVLFDRRTGFIAGALLASSTLLVVESGIAKTDAALLAATLLGLWSLASAWKARDKDEALSPLVAYSFWIGLGAGVLIKGPVVMMTLGLTLLVLGGLAGSLSWAKVLRPLRGGLIMLAMVLPWFVAIYFATDGAFYAEALGKDFGGKIASGQESHGAPPGLYLALVWITFWPASLLLIPSAWWAIGARANTGVQFLAAWTLPSWVIIEFIPTKLPHYALPLYPALALMIAAAMMAALTRTDTASLTKGWAARIGLVLWLVPGGLLLAAIGVLPALYGNGFVPGLAISSGLGFLLLIGTALFFWRGALLRATFAASLTGLFVFSFLFEATMGQLDALKLSPRLQQRLAQEDIPFAAEQTGILGYSEPSLVFLNGTGTHLLGRKQARAFIEGGGKILIVEDREQETLGQIMAQGRWRLDPVDVLRGHNYSKGRDVTLTIYKVEEIGS